MYVPLRLLCALCAFVQCVCMRVPLWMLYVHGVCAFASCVCVQACLCVCAGPCCVAPMCCAGRVCTLRARGSVRAACRRPAEAREGFKAAFWAAGVSAPDKQPPSPEQRRCGRGAASRRAWQLGSSAARPGSGSLSPGGRAGEAAGGREKYLLQPLITEFEIPASRCHLFSEAVKAGFSI